MNIVCNAHVPHNTGWCAEMKKTDLPVGGKPVDVIIYET